MSRREQIVVPLVLAMLVGAWVACAAYAGSLTIPHNDSWGHSKIAEVLADTGRIQLVGWNRSFLMGMIVPVGLVGGSVLAGNLFAAFCSFFMLYWAYKYARLHVPVRLAWVITAAIVVVPGVPLLSTSFMSDIPMCAAIAGALYYCQQYFNRDSSKYLAVATILAAWSFTIREQGLAVIAAIFLVLVLKKHYRNAVRFAVISGVAVLLLEVWRRGLDNDDVPTLNLDILQATDNVFAGVLSFSLFLLPITVLGASEESFWNKRNVPVALVVSACAFIYAAHENFEAFPPNYLSWKGAYSIAAVGERQVFSPLFEHALSAVAAMAVGPLCVFAVRNLFTTENLVGKIFSVFYFAGIVAQTYTGQGMFGRYMLPLLMALAPTIVQNVVSRTRSKVTFFVSLAMLALVSAALFLEGLAFDGAVWKQAESEVAAGTPAMDIEAGFTWYGVHSEVAANQAAPTRDDNFTPYAAMFTDARECVVIGAYDPRYENAEVVGTYKNYLIFGHDVNIYREQLSPCR